MKNLRLCILVAVAGVSASLFAQGPSPVMFDRSSGHLYLPGNATVNSTLAIVSGGQLVAGSGSVINLANATVTFGNFTTTLVAAANFTTSYVGLQLLNLSQGNGTAAGNSSSLKFSGNQVLANATVQPVNFFVGSNLSANGGYSPSLDISAQVNNGITSRVLSINSNGNLTIPGNLSVNTISTGTYSANISNASFTAGSTLTGNVIFKSTPAAGATGILVNQNTAPLIYFNNYATQMVLNAGDAASGGIEVNTYAHSGGSFGGGRAQGTGASPTATTAGVTLAEFYGYGFNGTNWAGDTASMRIISSENYDGTHNGSSIQFTVTPNGSFGGSGNKIALQLGNDGSLTLGQNQINPAGSSGNFRAFSVNSNITQSGTAGYAAFFANVTETSTGSGPKNLVQLQVNSTDKFLIDDTATITAGTLAANIGNATFVAGSNITGNATFLPTATNGVSGLVVSENPNATSFAPGGTSPYVASFVNKDGGGLGVNVVAFGSGSAIVGGFRSQGTAASKTASTAGNVLSQFFGGGWDGTNWGYGSLIGFNAAETWTTSAHGSIINFKVTPNGTTAMFQAMQINNDASMGLITVNSTIASGTFNGYVLEPSLNQSGTAGYSGLVVNARENAVGSGNHFILDLRVGNTTVASVGNTGTLATSGNISISTAGNGIFIKSGTNAKAGTVTLTSGNATVSTTAYTANSTVMYGLKTASGTIAGKPFESAVVAGTSFNVTAGPSDNSTYNWVIIDKQ